MQREFLDYLNSALRSRVTLSLGSAGRTSDGRLESTVTGTFTLGAASVPLTWRLLRATDGESLESLEAVGAENAPPESEWKVTALEFVNSVLSATLAAQKTRYFRRTLFYYIGEQLDGEYWLPGFRFAPVLPDDDLPMLWNAERVVAIEMDVFAVDANHAGSLADEAARRHAARLSLLLNRGLQRHEQELRWTMPTPFESEVASYESQRRSLGFYSPTAFRASMPAKGEICPLGKYEGSLTARYRSAGDRLSLPREARRILRYVDTAPPETRLPFDRGARLYQVGAVIGRRFPSAGLAYRVAALDAISQANGSKAVLTEFLKRYATPSPDHDGVVDYLWGPIRSAHFHGGEFPLGEFAPVRVFEPLMDAAETTQEQFQRHCYEITREAIVRWLHERLLLTSEPGESEERPAAD